MADSRRKKQNSPYLFYLVIFLIFLAAGALLLPVYRNYQKKRGELSGLQRELNGKKSECAVLHNQVNAIRNSPEAVEKVARENFGLCKEGETIYKYPTLNKNQKDLEHKNRQVQ